MNIVLPSIMSKWPQRIVFTDRLSISAQIAVQFIPEDDEKNKSSQFIFSPEILQSWIMIWFVTVSARDLNFALFTFFPSEKITLFSFFMPHLCLQNGSSRFEQSTLPPPRLRHLFIDCTLSQSFYFECVNPSSFEFMLKDFTFPPYRTLYLQRNFYFSKWNLKVTGSPGQTRSLMCTDDMTSNRWALLVCTGWYWLSRG